MNEARKLERELLGGRELEGRRNQGQRVRLTKKILKGGVYARKKYILGEIKKELVWGKSTHSVGRKKWGWEAGNARKRRKNQTGSINGRRCPREAGNEGGEQGEGSGGEKKYRKGTPRRKDPLPPEGGEI